MAYSKVKVSEVLDSVREHAAQPFVAQIEDHFAGYWDELGMTIILESGASDSDVIGLRNPLLSYLAAALPKGNPHFLWLVRFKREGKIIEVLLPGDESREATDVLRPS